MNNLLKDFKIQPTKLRGENMLDENELLFDELYEKTKDCGRVQFIKLLMSKERENKILRENAEHNDKVVDKVNWELNNLKAIEKEHQRMNGELRKELEGYQQMYFDKVMIINKAIEYIEKHIRFDDEYPAYMELLIVERDELLEILKGETNER